MKEAEAQMSLRDCYSEWGLPGGSQGFYWKLTSMVGVSNGAENSGSKGIFTQLLPRVPISHVQNSHQNPGNFLKKLNVQGKVCSCGLMLVLLK